VAQAIRAMRWLYLLAAVALAVALALVLARATSAQDFRNSEDFDSPARELLARRDQDTPGYR
jgi:hypothetical protein